MTKSKVFDRSLWLHRIALSAIAALIVFALSAPAPAQDEEPPTDRTVTTEVGEDLLEAREMLDQDQFSRASEILTRLANGELTAFERMVVLTTRARANFQLDRTDATIRDFEGAIATGAMTNDEIINTRTTLGQIHAANDNLDEAIRQFQLALQAGAQLNVDLARILASVHAQADRWQEGLRYAEFFYNNGSNLSENEYTLMQAYYQELNRPRDQLQVVRAMVNRFPGSTRSWQNLVALYSRLEQTENAFEANKLMYLNGLFENEERLLALVQYYSFFENPYRGATILEREMNADRVERDQSNLQLLGRLWRQAAEFDRAIPVLEQLSNLMGDGETALQLAEAHFQLNNYAAAETALETAVARGGLSDTGKAYELLGNARFEQDKTQEALAAFRQATNYASSRRTAQSFIQFINSQIAGAERRERQRRQVLIDGCRLSLDAERRIATVVGDADEDGNVRLEVPERCQQYFNVFGDQILSADLEPMGPALEEAEGEEAQG